VRRIVDEKVCRKAQRQYSQISGWISEDGKLIVWSHMFPCPRRLKVSKGEKYIHSRLLNYPNIKKNIIKFTCTNPRNVSAKKDVVGTFTLQLLITLFPQSTGSHLYYQREPLSGDGSFSEWLRVDTFRRWCCAHEKGVRHHTNASDEANADQ